MVLESLRRENVVSVRHHVFIRITQAIILCGNITCMNQLVYFSLGGISDPFINFCGSFYTVSKIKTSSSYVECLPQILAKLGMQFQLTSSVKAICCGQIEIF